MSMADDIIDGMFDSISGEYLGDAVGYPRTIHEDSPRGKKRNNSDMGIHYFLYRNGFKNYETHNGIVNRYLKSIDKKQPNVVKFKAKCNIIQEDFKSFKKWFNKTYN